MTDTAQPITQEEAEAFVRRVLATMYWFSFLTKEERKG